MSRDNLINIQMKALKVLQRPGIFFQIGKSKVAKLLF